MVVFVHDTLKLRGKPAEMCRGNLKLVVFFDEMLHTEDERKGGEGHVFR